MTRNIFILIFAALAGLWSGSATAGETQLYLKSGYFTWEETIAGQDFVKEKGMMHAFGIARSDTVAGILTLRELFEMWGGSLDYDGHDITNTTVLKSDTVYLGTREELAAQLHFPASDRLKAGPLAGVGHKFWIRTRSNEDWNVIYGRLGAAAEYAVGEYSMFLSGGASLPFYTRSHVNLGAAGLQDVVTTPKGKASVFVEASLRRSSWSAGLSYEEMNFGESGKVRTRSTAPLQNGMAVVDSQAFQPKSSSSLLALNIRYHF